MKKNNIYPCFSKKRAIQLKDWGFKVISVDINHKYPQYFVYYFERTPEFEEALIRLCKIDELNKTNKTGII